MLRANGQKTSGLSSAEQPFAEHRAQIGLHATRSRRMERSAVRKTLKPQRHPQSLVQTAPSGRHLRSACMHVPQVACASRANASRPSLTGRRLILHTSIALEPRSPLVVSATLPSPHAHPSLHQRSGSARLRTSASLKVYTRRVPCPFGASALPLAFLALNPRGLCAFEAFFLPSFPALDVPDRLENDALWLLRKQQRFGKKAQNGAHKKSEVHKAQKEATSSHQVLARAGVRTK